jgi:GT2 family glycosyltransferase
MRLRADLPVVSFVVPVRDDAARLRRCLESIAANDYAAECVEVIVIDNGSRDGSADVARQCGATVLQITGVGVAGLRNRGAAAARGQILAFVDADHEIDAHWVRQAVTALACPGVAAAGAPCVPPADGTWVQLRYDGLRERVDEPVDVAWLGSGNLAIRRDAFDAMGGFDTSLETCEDVDLCQRLGAAGYRILCDPKLRNIHFGDPASLGALFAGELWRGRDNLRVTLRGPRTLRHFRSVLVPIADLAAVALFVIALATGSVLLATVAALVVIGLAALRASVMIRRDVAPTLIHGGQALAVALVYDAGRAAALVMRGNHRLRRSTEDSTHVTANSHP